MRKKTKVVLTTKRYAEMRGVARQSVVRAIERGDIPASAVARRGKGKRAVFAIVDVELANRSWAPTAAERPDDPACEPGQLSDLSTMAEARRVRTVYLARQARLEFEVAAGKLIEVETARQVFAKQIAEAKNAVMALGKHARSRIPHLTVDDALVIEELLREALESLDPDGAAKAAQKASAGK